MLAEFEPGTSSLRIQCYGYQGVLPRKCLLFKNFSNYFINIDVNNMHRSEVQKN